MAEKKHTTVQAAVFKTTMKTNYEVDIKRTDKKFSKLVPIESTVLHSRSNPNHRSSELKDMKNGRKMKPSRMLIYEDCSEEEEEPFRSTPPNIQDRSIETPGAPIKSRKEFEAKVLRPKKLVYNDKENDTEDLGKENLFYHSTPKNSEGKDVGGDFYYGKLINFTAIIPRKIVPIREDDGLSVYPTNQEFDFPSERESRSDQQDRNKSNLKGGRKKKLNNEARKGSSRSRSAKHDFNSNKENDARQFGTENDLEDAKFSSELSKNKSMKNTDRNREELMNLSKIGKLTHFRM